MYEASRLETDATLQKDLDKKRRKIQGEIGYDALLDHGKSDKQQTGHTATEGKGWEHVVGNFLNDVENYYTQTRFGNENGEINAYIDNPSWYESMQHATAKQLDNTDSKALGFVLKGKLAKFVRQLKKSENKSGFMKKLKDKAESETNGINFDKSQFVKICGKFAAQEPSVKCVELEKILEKIEKQMEGHDIATYKVGSKSLGNLLTSIGSDGSEDLLKIEQLADEFFTDEEVVDEAPIIIADDKTKFEDDKFNMTDHLGKKKKNPSSPTGFSETNSDSAHNISGEKNVFSWAYDKMTNLFTGGSQEDETSGALRRE